jgi:GNAT superfamily N-acetyltransferase
MHLDQGVGNCSWLMVDRTHQKKGIGKKLVTAMEEEMKKIGDHSVNIYASEWNIPFYKKLGYELVGLYKKAWFGADYYLFVKTIQEPKEENFLR